MFQEVLGVRRPPDLSPLQLQRPPLQDPGRGRRRPGPAPPVLRVPARARRQRVRHGGPASAGLLPDPHGLCHVRQRTWARWTNPRGPPGDLRPGAGAGAGGGGPAALPAKPAAEAASAQSEALVEGVRLHTRRVSSKFPCARGPGSRVRPLLRVRPLKEVALDGQDARVSGQLMTTAMPLQLPLFGRARRVAAGSGRPRADRAYGTGRWMARRPPPGAVLLRFPPGCGFAPQTQTFFEEKRSAARADSHPNPPTSPRPRWQGGGAGHAGGVLHRPHAGVGR